MSEEGGKAITVIPKFLAGAPGTMLAEVGTPERAVGSALVMSSLGTLGHPGPEESLAWGRGGIWIYKKSDRFGETLGTLAFKGWAADAQPPKDPGQAQGPRDKEGRWADSGSSRSGGALPT